MRFKSTRFRLRLIPVVICTLVVLCCILPTYVFNGRFPFWPKANTVPVTEIFGENGIRKTAFFDLVESTNESHGSILDVEHDKFHGDLHHDSFRNPKIVTKVAIIVPYVGDSLPTWFDVFCMTAASSASLYDWIILVTDAPLRQTPPNVKLVQMNEDDLYRRIATLDNAITSTTTDDDAISAEEVNVAMVRKLLTLQPYMMVELKPCFGFLFYDLISTYSHWAYADIDQLVGRLHNIIPVSTLNRYDIVTTSFGDNYRMYMRGQLTIHRNDPFINNLWRSCVHLSHLADRLKQYRETHYKKWIFHSAEGCYSRVVADHPDVSVYISSSQISDAIPAPSLERESLYLGNALFRCYGGEPIIKMSRGSGSASGTYSVEAPAALRVVRNILLSSTQLDAKPIAANAVSIRRMDYECAYWLPPQFQVCLSSVPAHVDISSIHGNYSYSAKDTHLSVASCREASTTHFQRWKKNYYLFMARAPSPDVRALVLGEHGIVPLRLAVVSETSGSLRGSTTEAIEQLPTFGELGGSKVVHGRLHPSDIALAGSFAKGLRGKLGISLERFLGDFGSDTANTVLNENMNTQSQRGSGSKKTESVDKNVNSLRSKKDGLATNYCALFSSDLKRCKCPILGGHIRVTQVAALRKMQGDAYFADLDVSLSEIQAEGVTMVSAAWVSDFYDGALNNMLDTWSGPKILVLGFIGSSPSNSYPRADVTVLEVDLTPCRSQGEDVLPDSTLFNIGLDAASTDLVAVFPRGLIPQPPYGLDADNPAAASVLQQISQAQNAPDNNGLPVALVLPTYVLHVQTDMDQEMRRQLEIDDKSGKKSKDLAREKERHLVPYPSVKGTVLDEGQCGFGQSKKLAYDYFKRSYDIVKYGNALGGGAASEVYPKLDFSAKEFTAAHTLTIPFIFNQSAGAHGMKFVRFPEEIGGHGCFGSTIFRVLAGSGFSLRWAGLNAFASSTSLRESKTSEQEKTSGSVKCKCAHSDYFDLEKSLAFSDRLNKYYHRVVELRSEGIGNLHSRDVFGEKQMEEQQAFMATAGDNAAKAGIQVKKAKRNKRTSNTEKEGVSA